MQIQFGYFISELLMGFFISILIFLYGISLIRSLRKQWGDFNAIIINVAWLVLSIFFNAILIILFFDPNSTIILISDIIRIIIVILFASVLVRKYESNFLIPLKYNALFQVILYGLNILVTGLIDVIQVMVTSTNDRIFGGGLTLLFICLIMLGINTFYINWGNKAQFIKNKNALILITLVPGFLYLSSIYYEIPDMFTRGFFNYAIIAVVITMLASTVVKIIIQSRLTFQRYRELTVLDQDKDLLEVNDLKVYYPLIGGVLKRQFGSVKAVDGVTFNIKTGETVGLVGESGCGKSTVAYAILGLVPKEEGKIIFNGKPIPNEYTKTLRRKIQIVYQDPDASLNPRMKVVDIIAEPLRNLLGITRKDEIRKRVLDLLHEVSLEREHMDRYPHEFSGGQKQRIIIARALASNPELVILDEPTSALDVSVQAQILNLLKKLQQSYGYGFLFITHNLSVVNHIADKVAVMYLGKFVEVGNTDQIFSNPSHPYTQALLASRTELDPKNKEISFVIKGEVPSPIAPPPGCTFNPRCISEAKTQDCMRVAPHPIKIEEGHYIWCVNPPVSMQKQIYLMKDLKQGEIALKQKDLEMDD